MAKISPYIVGGYKVPDISIDEWTFLKISAETKPGSSKLKFNLPSCLVPSSKVTDSAEVPWNLLRLLRRMEIFSASFSFESTNSVSTSVTTLAKVLARVSTLYSFLGTVFAVV